MSGFLPGYPVPREKWVEKGDTCGDCGKRFTFFTSKANCPHCGRLYCADCLKGVCTIVSGGQPTQVCVPCFTIVQEQQHRISAVRSGEKASQAAHQTAAGPPLPQSVGDAAVRTCGESSMGTTREEMMNNLYELSRKSQELREENNELLAAAIRKEDALARMTESLKAMEEQRESDVRQRREGESAVAEALRQERASVRQLQRDLRAVQLQFAQVVGDKKCSDERSGAAHEDLVAARAECEQLRSELQTVAAAATQRQRQQEPKQESTLEEYNKHAEELERERGRATAAEESAASLREELSAAKVKLQESLAALSSKEKEAADSAKELGELRRAQVEQAARAADAPEGRMTAMAESAAHLKSEKEQLAVAHEAVRCHCVAAQEATEASAAMEEKLRREIVDLQRVASERTRQQQDAERLAQKCHANVTAAETRCDAAEARAQSLERERDALAEKLSYEHQQHGAIKEELARLLEQMAVLEEAAAATACTNVSRTADTEESSANNANILRRSLKQATQQLRAAKEQLAEKDATVKALRKGKMAAEMRLRELQQNYKALAQSATGSMARCEQAEAAAKDARDKHAALLLESAKERNALSKKVEQLRQKLSDAKEQQSSAARVTPHDFLFAEEPPTRDGSSRWRRPSLVEALRLTVPTVSELRFRADKPLDTDTLFQWSFDIPAAAETVPSILQYVATAIAQRLKLFPSEDGLRRWQVMMAMVEANYRSNPYHAALHAADVAHGVCALLLAAPALLRGTTRVERLAIIFAALIHDVRHPGVSAAFLKQRFDPVYLLYNGKSPLEQMHTATAFSLLAVPEADFTVDMTDSEALELHHAVAHVIGHTDMATHGSSFAAWRQRADSGAYNLSDAKDRLEVMALLLHAADVGAQAKGVAVSQKWLTVLEEMYQQGDKEKQLGMHVSFGCTRPASGEGARGIKEQLGFMRAFVIPLFQVVQVLFPSIQAPLGNLRQLYAWYQRQCDDCEPFPQPPLAERRADDAAEAAASNAREEQRTESLRGAYARITKAAAKVAARDADVAQREAALHSLEERVANDLRGLSGAASQHGGAVRGEGSEGIDEKLLRATARVVEREAQVRGRARELEAQAKDLEARERATAVLSDQLSAIAERIIRQRKRLARLEGAARSPTASPSREASRPVGSTLVLGEHRDVVLARLSEAVQHLSAAVQRAPL